MDTRRLICTLTLLFGGVQVSAGQTETLRYEFDAEFVGGVPEKWHASSAAQSPYVIETVEGGAKGEGRCVRILSEGSPTPEQFGNIMQSIDATPYRGEMVRFSATVRAEVAGGHSARLWLRVDRPDGQPGFFDNMSDRPIRSRGWGRYEIIGRVEDDAFRLNYGMMLVNEGKAYFDDVVLEIVNEGGLSEIAPPRPLEGKGLENLKAFTRMLGYVRYFHPSDEAAQTDWDALAIRGVREIESADSAKELAERLEALFKPIAPTVRVWPKGQRVERPEGLEKPTGERIYVRRWEHTGVGVEENPNSIYHSQRARKPVKKEGVPEGWTAPEEPFIANIGDVTCMIAATLYADDLRTLPRGESEGAEEHAPVAYYTGNDRTTRLADAATTWNVFQHFYPYFDVVETDWDEVLEETLKRAATDENDLAFLHTLQEMVAQLHDGHGSVSHRSLSTYAQPPIAWTWVGDVLVVTYVPPDVAYDIKPGDVVTAIDGRPTGEVYAEQARRISGSPQWVRYRSLFKVAAGVEGREVELTLKRDDGRTWTATLKRTNDMKQCREPRPDVVTEMKPGIFYVDMDRITDGEFIEALPKLEEAAGVVFDFRGYPSDIRPFTWLTHMTETSLTSPQWHTPKILKPNREGMAFSRGGEWYIAAAAPYLAAKKAFIIDGRAISYAESCMGIVENYKLGEIVGTPTAGTNGNATKFSLPGGYEIRWTGMKVLKHDGTQHHLIGIRPTIPVERTLAGIKEGRDELLERAITAVEE